MCSGSEEGSYVRLMDFVYHSTLGGRAYKVNLLFFFFISFKPRIE